MARTRIPLLPLVLVALAVPTAARGGTLTADQEAVEAMINAQGVDAAFLAGAFGPDGRSPLAFGSTIDDAGRSFAYATAQGSTYLGMPVSVASSGSFDAATASWNWSSAVTLGAASWVDVGSGQFLGDPDFPIDASTTILGLKLSLHIDDQILVVNGGPESLGTATLTVGSHSFGATVHDFLFNGSWEWDWRNTTFTASDVAITGVGQTPPGGGPGMFVTRIQAVPEPPALIPAITGVLGALGLFRPRRAGPASRSIATNPTRDESGRLATSRST